MGLEFGLWSDIEENGEPVRRVGRIESLIITTLVLICIGTFLLPFFGE